MKPLILLSIAVAAMAPGLASAQVAKTARPVQLKATQSKMTAGVTGIVAKDGIKPGQFMLGVKDKGRMTVDSTKATFRWRNGKVFEPKRLVGGAMVSIQGDIVGKTVKAKMITVNYLPDTKATTKVAKPKPVKTKN